MKSLNIKDNVNLYFIKTTHQPRRRVIKIDPVTNKVLAVFPSMKEAAESIGVCPVNIYDCANGHQKTSGGYRWEYLKEAKK